MKRIGVALYGTEGHQLQDLLEDHPLAHVVAVCACAPDKIPAHLHGVRVHAELNALLADPEVDLVSFCSPRKDEQGGEVIRCLEAGKHAYAEKPCCMDEATMDRIVATAKRAWKIFHEMGGTAFAQPYCTLRDIVVSGVIGEVIQVVSQKSYPWTDWRPGDERVDGGLALQVGVYIARFAEHVAGVKIASMQMCETKLGNDVSGSECRRAVSFLMTFENGGVGSGAANYCCPASPGWKNWGYESLQIFGSRGFVESLDGGRIGTLAINGQAPRALDFSAPGRSWLDMFFEEISTGKKVIPYTLEKELSPTRWVIRAKAACVRSRLIKDNT
jgi:predicted dehydrogenase